jgi:hypothetical protein
MPTNHIIADAPRDTGVPKIEGRDDDRDCHDYLPLLDKGVQINFDAPATLRKWWSLKNERVDSCLGARPYLIIDGTLGDCIRRFLALPISQHHLYEIHTAAQSDLVRAVLSPAHIVELAGQRDALWV